MNPPLSRRDVLRRLGFVAGMWWAARAEARDIPGDSVYQLRAQLTDQDGRSFELSSLRGQAVLVSMFYSSCKQVCPMIFETIRLTLLALPVADRERVRVMMISFDPARDSVAVLKATAEAHRCDARWALLRAEDAEVRRIAAVLGVQYRRLASGEFNHSSAIELLDTEGRIAARTGTLGAADPGFVKAVRKALSRQA